MRILISFLDSDDVGHVEIGHVEVYQSQTFADLRKTIGFCLSIPEFVFLEENIPYTRLEEKKRYMSPLQHHPFSPFHAQLHNLKISPLRPAGDVASVVIRGQELRVEANNKREKLTVIQQEEEKKRKQTMEFSGVLNKVRGGLFLRSVGRDLTK
jgi:hypothetical protein